MTIKSQALFALLLGVVGMASNAGAATTNFYWVGGTSTAWGTDANWSPAVAPNSAAASTSDIAVFDHHFAVGNFQPATTSSKSIAGIYMTNTAQNVVISLGGNLQITTNGVVKENTDGYTLTIGNNSATLNFFASQTWSNRSSGVLNFTKANLNARTLTLDGPGDFAFTAGVLSGAGGSIVKNGSGTLTLAALNNASYTGGFTLNAGQVNLNVNQVKLGTGTFTIAGNGSVKIDNTSAGTVTMSDVGPWAVDSDFTFVGTRSLTGGSGAVTLNNSTRTITVSSNTLTLPGIVGDSGGGLIKNGGGVLALTGANTYTGPSTVYAGRLTLTTASAGGGAITVATNANMTVTVATTNGTLNTSALTLGVNATDRCGLTLALGAQPNPTTAPITVGSLAANGTNTITITGTGLTVGQFPLIAYTGSLGGQGFAAFAVPVLPAGYAGVLVSNATSVDLNITAAQASLSYVWLGNTDTSWDIGTTTNWLDTNLLAAAYTETAGVGPVVLFNDSATNFAVNVTTPVSPAGLTVNNSSNNYTFGGSSISVTGQVVKTGSAALTLGSANAFSGGLLLQGTGTLRIGNNSALGTGRLTANGGTTLSSDSVNARTLANAVTVNANMTLGDAVNNGPLTLSGPMDLTLGNRTLTVNSPVLQSGGSTNGSLMKAGADTLTLQGVHTWSANFEVDNGMLVLDGAKVTNSSAFAGSGVTCQTNSTAHLVVTNGGALVLTDTTAVLRLGYSAFGNTTAGGLASGATNILDVAGLVALPNATGSANGPGRLMIGRASVLSVVNLLPGGELRVNKVTNGDIAANRTPNQFNFNGGVLRPTSIDNATAFMQGLDNAYVLNGGAIIDTAGFSITVNQSLLTDGVGSGGLTKNGNGTLTLGGTNTYTGANVVNGGKLVIPTTVTGGGPITVADPGSLGVTVKTQNETLNASAITLGASASHNGVLDISLGAFINPTTAPLTTSGTLSASGTNTINITGTALVRGQFPLIKYSGILAGGVFGSFQLGPLPAGIGGVLVDNTANGSIDLSITNGPLAPLEWRGYVDGSWDINTTSNWLSTATGVQANYTEIAGVGPQVTFNDNASLFAVNVAAAVRPAKITVSAFSDYTIGGAFPIAGTGAVVKASSGALTLTNANSYSGGTTLSAGTLRVGAAGALGSGLLTLSGGVMSSDSGTARTVANSASVTAGLTLGDAVNTGVVNLSGVINWNNAARALTVASDTILSGGSTNGAFSKVGLGILTLKGDHRFSNIAEIRDGDVVLDAATVTSTVALPRPNCNLPFGTARMVLTNGAVLTSGTNSPNVRAGANGNIDGTNIIDVAGTIAATNGVAVLGSSCGLGQLNLLHGGVLNVIRVISGDSTIYNGDSQFNFDGGTLRAAISTVTFMEGLTNASVKNGGAIIDSAGFNITIAQPLLEGGTGGLTKLGAGILRLNGINTYTNTTAVNEGTLAGIGTIAGPVSVAAGATLAPGDGGIGTLTVANHLTLAGGSTVSVEVNKDTLTTDLVAGLGNVSYAGTLRVTNTGTNNLVGGETFQLFSATGTKSGNFTNITILPATGVTGSFNPSTGVLTIVPLPPNISFSLSGGNTLELAWPASYLGWIAQSNAVSVATASAWFDISGSQTATNLSLGINPALTNVFYRLRAP